MKSLLFFILLTISCRGIAQEIEMFEKILNQTEIGVDSFYNSYEGINAMWVEDNKHFLVCTIDSERIVYVVPIVSDVYDRNTYELDNHLFLIDRNGVLLNHLCEPSKWISDAVCLTDILLKDNNKLGKNIVAIGIENRTSASGWVLGECRELSIYSIENNQINNVLDKFPIYKLNGEPVGLPDDEPLNRTLTREIRFLSTRSNGYYDIEVKNIIKKTDSWNDDDDPKNNSIRMLKYNLDKKQYE